MKVRILLVCAAAALAVPASASAFQWHLSFWRAKAVTKAYEREHCEHDGRCIAYGASCERVSESRVDCLGGTIDETAYGELECTSLYHWGVRAGGYATLHIGHPHCAYVS